MRVGFLGCGAMGSIFAGYLSRAHEVYVYDVSKEHVNEIQKNGIRIEELGGLVNTYRPCLATTDPNEISPVDILLVFVKYNYIEGALRKAAGMVDEHTIVLSLQNGMGNCDEIAKVIPEERICCGTTAHGSIFLGPGNVRHTGIGITNVGALKGDVALAGRVAEILKAGGIEAAVKENVAELIWHKLFANIAINGITALLEQTNGTVYDNLYERNLAVNLVGEAVSVANASGCHFDLLKELESVYDVAAATTSNKSSMYQAVTNHKETEIDIINGAVVKLGKEYHIPTPYNDVIWNLVHAKQSFYLS